MNLLKILIILMALPITGYAQPTANQITTDFTDAYYNKTGDFSNSSTEFGFLYDSAINGQAYEIIFHDTSPAPSNPTYTIPASVTTQAELNCQTLLISDHLISSTWSSQIQNTYTGTYSDRGVTRYFTKRLYSTPLQANFTTSTTDSMTWTFTNTTSNIKAPVAYLWDFAGLATSTSTSPSYTFPDSNTFYQITLTATDSSPPSSNTSSTSKSIKTPTPITPPDSDVTGDLVQGSTVVISGTGFGASGPIIEFYDDFESGTDAQQFLDANTPISAVVGTYVEINNSWGVWPEYDTEYSVSGITSYYQGDSFDGSTVGRSYANFVNGNTNTGENGEMYFTTWVRSDPAFDIGGNPENWKPLWFTYNHSTTLSDIFIGWIGYFKIDGNDGNTLAEDIYGLDFTAGPWHRWGFWFDTSSNGTGDWAITEVNSSIPYNTVETAAQADFPADNVRRTNSGTNFWNGFILNGTNNQPFRSWFDDIYVASGPNSRARVELGNQPTLTACTSLHIQRPTSWSDTQISVVFNQGTFNSGDTAYLFVIDRADNVIATYPVTIGAGQPPTANFSATPLSGNAPLAVQFTDESSNPQTWSWNFGNGQTSTQQNPLVTYNSAGTYTVSLTVTNSDGSNTNTKPSYITVTDTGIGVDPIIQSISGTLAHNNTITILGNNFGTKTTDLPYLFEDFETGSLSANSKMSITGGNIISEITTVTDPRLVTQRTPHSNYQLYYNKTDNNNGFGFVNRVGSSQDAGHLRWYASFWVYFDPLTWDVGYDGENNFKIFRFEGSVDPQWVDFAAQTFNNLFEYCDRQTYYAEPPIDYNAWNHFEMEIELGASQKIWINNELFPTAFSCTEGDASYWPFCIGFNDVFNNDVDEDRAVHDDFYWDWSWARVELGDSNTYDSCTYKEVQIPQTWSDTQITATLKQGNFANNTVAYLYVTDSDGVVSPAYPVTIAQGVQTPIANFSGTPTSGTVPLTVQFTDSSTNGPTSWSWDFGDGNTSTAQNPSHTYNQEGTYTVSLTVDGSNTNTKTNYITVSQVVQTSPSVQSSSANPNYSNGNTVTLTGTNFKTKVTPAAVSFGTAEDGTYTSYNLTSRFTDPSIVSDSRYNNSLNVYSQDVSSATSLGFYPTNSPTSESWLAHYWFKVDANLDWGTTPPEDLSDVNFIEIGTPIEYFYLNRTSLNNANIACLTDSVAYTSSYTPTADTWIQATVEYKQSTTSSSSDGLFRVWFGNNRVINETAICTGTANKQFKYVGFNNIYGSSGIQAPDDFYMDDVYVDSTLARVELINNSVYSSATVREIQPITSWSNTSIQFTLNTASFGPGDTPYIIVTDRNGNKSTPTQITIYNPVPAGNPTITGVLGTISQNQLVTITGTSFSTKSPAAPLVWETFNSGTPLNSLYSENSSWIPYQNLGGRFSNGYMRNGTVNVVNSPPINGAFSTNYITFAATDTIFVSSWRLFQNYDGTGIPIMGNVGSTAVGATYQGTGNWSWRGDSWLHYKNDLTTLQQQNTGILPQTITPTNINDIWERSDFILANSTPDASDGTVILDVIDNAKYEAISSLNLQLSTDEFAWGSYQLGLSVIQSTDTSFGVYVDDVYVDNTWARVEIGNDPVYENCTHREMQIPTSWSNDSITIQFNHGSFDVGNQVYLFVIDRENNVSDGRAITIENIAQTVVFETGFETGNFNEFDDYDGNPSPTNVLVSDPGPFNISGNTVARLRAPLTAGSSADLVKVLPSSYDELYAEWYIKFEPGFDLTAENHGGGFHAGDRNYLGSSGNQPNGTDWFSIWVDYTTDTNKFRTYNYYPGMYQNCTGPGTCFGDEIPCTADGGSVFCTLPSDRPGELGPTIQTDQWYHIKIYVNAGTPTASEVGATGVFNMWVDGVELGPWTNKWFRSTADLKVNILFLQLYHHNADHSVEGILLDDIKVYTIDDGSPSAILNVAQGDSLTAVGLSGILSTDPDGTVESLIYRMGDGIERTLAATDTVLHNYTSSQLTSNRILQAELVAIDNSGLRDSTIADVVIKGSTPPPTTGNPTISSLSGTATHNSLLVINGSNFETKTTAAPMFFEDFETGGFNPANLGLYEINDGVNNTDVISTVNSTELVQRSQYSTYNLYANMVANNNGFGVMLRFDTPRYRKWYASYWVYLDPLTWDYSNDNNNLKLFRYLTSGGVDVDAAWSVSGNGLVDCVNNLFGSGDPGGHLGGYGDFPTSLFPYGQWHLIEQELDSANGHQKVWVNGVLRSYTEVCDTGTPVSAELHGFNSVRNDLTDTDKLVHDDFYLDNTWQRVVLSNTSNFESTSHRELQVPTQWTNTQITVRFKQNSFSNGSNLFLYIIDTDGNVSSPFPITIGQSY